VGLERTGDGRCASRKDHSAGNAYRTCIILCVPVSSIANAHERTAGQARRKRGEEKPAGWASALWNSDDVPPAVHRERQASAPRSKRCSSSAARACPACGTSAGEATPSTENTRPQFPLSLAPCYIPAGPVTSCIWRGWVTLTRRRSAPPVASSQRTTTRGRCGGGAVPGRMGEPGGGEGGDGGFSRCESGEGRGTEWRSRANGPLTVRIGWLDGVDGHNAGDARNDGSAVDVNSLVASDDD
jgi:hypothetical protein